MFFFYLLLIKNAILILKQKNLHHTQFFKIKKVQMAQIFLENEMELKRGLDGINNKLFLVANERTNF